MHINLKCINKSDIVYNIHNNITNNMYNILRVLNNIYIYIYVYMSIYINRERDKQTHIHSLLYLIDGSRIRGKINSQSFSVAVVVVYTRTVVILCLFLPSSVSYSLFSSAHLSNSSSSSAPSVPTRHCLCIRPCIFFGL